MWSWVCSQALLGAGRGTFRDVKGSASSHSFWLFAFNVLLLVLFVKEHRLWRQKRAAELGTGKFNHLSVSLHMDVIPLCRASAVSTCTAGVVLFLVMQV